MWHKSPCLDCICDPFLFVARGLGILCVSEWIRFCSFTVCSSEMQVPFLRPTTFKVQNCRRAKKKKTQGPRELGSAALTPAGHDKEGERRELEREGQSSCFLRHAKLTSGGRSLQQNPEKLSEGWLCNSVRFHPKKMIPPPSQRHQRGEQKDAKREANVFFPAPVYLFSSFLPDTFPVVSSLDNVASETTQSSFLVERESWISVC